VVFRGFSIAKCCTPVGEPFDWVGIGMIEQSRTHDVRKVPAAETASGSRGKLTLVSQIACVQWTRFEFLMSRSSSIAVSLGDARGWQFPNCLVRSMSPRAPCVISALLISTELRCHGGALGSLDAAGENCAQFVVTVMLGRLQLRDASHTRVVTSMDSVARCPRLLSLRETERVG
jgi:hypothetical protein